MQRRWAWVVGLGLVLGGCAQESGWAPDVSDVEEVQVDQSGLRALIMGVEPPALPPEAPPAETESSTATERQGDQLHQCVYRRFEGTAHFESLVSFDPNADVLWPGAIVQSEGLPYGLLAPIGLARRPGTITITGASIDDVVTDDDQSLTLEVPSHASAQAGIAKLLDAKDVNLAAKASFIAEQAHSLKEAALKAGLSVDWMSGSVKSSFEGGWAKRRSTFVVRFVQSYFTASFAAPEAPERVFAPDVTVDDARPYMGPGNPPGYVSSVTYGRMLFVKIESDAAASDVKAAIDAVFSLGTADVEAGLETEHRQVMNEATVTVFALGGDPNDAIEIMTSSEDRAERLREYFSDGAGFSAESPGVPVSYTVRRLADNATIKVASTLDYEVPDCSPTAQSVKLHLDAIDVPNNGEAIGKAEIAYRVWVERDGESTLITEGTASKVPDGGSITLNQDHVLTLPERQGESLRLHAEISESGDKHVYPSRTHTFVLDQPTAGSWTQPGTNEVTQSNGNLSVLLRYDLTRL